MKFRLTILLTSITLFLSACSFSLAEDITPPPGYQSPTSPPTIGPLYPSANPNLENGAAIFVEKCAPCHGLNGMGDGPQGKQLDVSVTAFALPEIAHPAKPADWFLTVTRGNLDRFMPPFSNLTEQQRWDVVAYALTLSTTPAQVTQGKDLFDANCGSCHGVDGKSSPTVNLSDQVMMAQLSANDLNRIISQGNPPEMPAFESKLSEDERWTLTAYLRTLTFAAPEPAPSTPDPTLGTMPTSMQESVTGTPVSATTPEGTPVAMSTPVEGEVTSTTDATLEPTALPVGIGTISGKITNGSDSPLPSDLTFTLHGFDQDKASGGFQENVTLTTSVAENGIYKFADVVMPAGRAFIVSLEYGSVEYTSEPAFVTEGTDHYDLPITFYESTTDTSDLTVDRWHIFLDFTKSDTIQIIEVYVISNPSNRTIISEGGNPVVIFTLPEGAANLQLENGQLGDRFVQTSNGFGDTAAVLPGSGEHQLIFAFDLPYKRKLDFSQPVDLAVDSVIIMAPEGVTVKSDLLENTGMRDFQGTPYTLYSGQSIPTSGRLTMSISGKPKSTTSSPDGTDSRRNILIGVGAFGVVLILVGVWMYIRDRTRVDQGDEELTDEDELQDSESIMDAIITLDDLYRAGQLSEEAHQKRRAELKARLNKLL